MNLTITGASGFVGRHLLRRFPAQENSLIVLARKDPRLDPAIRFGPWNPNTEEAPAELLAPSQAIIHLAGESVSQRWTPDVKRRIRESRVLGTRHLVAGLRKLARPPEVLVAASAIGFYGNRGDDLLREDAAIGQGFLAEVCQEWEHEANQAKALGIRVVLLRLGIVLAADGGALATMAPLFRFGLGGRLGDGLQWMSWIHMEDLVGLIEFAAKEPKLHGIVNAVSPEPVRNLHFTQLLAKALHRPAIFPAPRFGVELVYGEMASMLFNSQRVIPRAALDAGFLFQYKRLPEALQAIYP